MSTEEQAEEGYGLAAQRAAIHEAAEQRGWTVVGIVEERISGRTVGPHLTNLLIGMDGHAADALVVAKLDRLTRSIVNGGSIIERARHKGWALVALDLGMDTSTPVGELMTNILLSFAQHERRIIGQRTKEGLAVARAQGVRLGRPPTLPAEVVDRILSARSSGASFQAVADDLNAAGVATAHGGLEWRKSSVRAVYLSATRP